ncbi:hypothetical protein LINGRAHAP2_LOCUS29054 [Linum grandiflorum]
MDYNLAALKLLNFQLKDARESSTPKVPTLGAILFQRAWLQGFIVSNCGNNRLLLDDGTGVIEILVTGDFRRRKWDVGFYVMVIGAYVLPTDKDPPSIKVHKMVDLSPFPDREAMWFLEVLEAYKLFYQPLIEDYT